MWQIKRNVFEIMTKSSFHSVLTYSSLFSFLYWILMISPVLILCTISILSISPFLILPPSLSAALQEFASKRSLGHQNRKKSGEQDNGFFSTNEHTGGADLPPLPGSSDRTIEPGLWPQLLPSLHHCKQQGACVRLRRGTPVPCMPEQIPALQPPA